jgi:S-adenosylmethionine synthetase
MYTFTSESVSEGHPDKVADFIADSILDAYLTDDRHSRVACEVLCKNDQVVLAGEITSNANVDVDRVVRSAVHEIGYNDPSQPFCSETLKITKLLTTQASEIGTGVDTGGAGDQGIMFGYAANETPELMPLPILLAHRVTYALAQARKEGVVEWLRPDCKSQVSVLYDDNSHPQQVATVVVSTQHSPDVDQETIRDFVTNQVLPKALGDWNRDGIQLHVNPTGSFVEGGPGTDAGVTGRKIIVDTYGGAARHGGGAFSGKDPTKVDRSAAYFCRFVARKVVEEGLAKRAEIQVAYAIGVAEPVSMKVDSFGTGSEAAAEEFLGNYDFRPQAIIEQLGLAAPIYRKTTNYGHFGRTGLPWESSTE